MMNCYYWSMWRAFETNVNSIDKEKRLQYNQIYPFFIWCDRLRLMKCNMCAFFDAFARMVQCVCPQSSNIPAKLILNQCSVPFLCFPTTSLSVACGINIASVVKDNWWALQSQLCISYHDQNNFKKLPFRWDFQRKSKAFLKKWELLCFVALCLDELSIEKAGFKSKEN